jgi:hypothetical protein
MGPSEGEARSAPDKDDGMRQGGVHGEEKVQKENRAWLSWLAWRGDRGACGCHHCVGTCDVRSRQGTRWCGHMCGEEEVCEEGHVQPPATEKRHAGRSGHMVAWLMKA